MICYCCHHQIHAVMVTWLSVSLSFCYLAFWVDRLAVSSAGYIAAKLKLVTKLSFVIVCICCIM